MNLRSVMMLTLILMVTRVFGVEDSNDTYLYRGYCPDGQNVTYEGQTRMFPGGAMSGGYFVYSATNANGSWVNKSFFADKWGFAQCNCTSYVAHALNERWSQSPWFNNGYYNIRNPNNTNQQLYWSDAKNWRDRAIQAGIGVTGARDNFTWDEPSYNAVFPGDVAWWDAWDYTDTQGVRHRNPYGHVAIVESAEPDAPGSGVSCVTLREYNWNPAVDLNRRTVCKSTGGRSFPISFLHIDQDHIYCLQHPDLCPGFSGGVGGVGGRGGAGIGGGTDTFNLKINNFWARDAVTQLDLVAGGHTVHTGQALEVRDQVKAVNGDTSVHMRPGKDRIEVDFWAREDDGDWRFVGRDYIQAVNLPSGATHTEHVVYTVPVGVSQISFKVKIDAEDEAYEANEGDNWSRVLAYTVDNNPVVNLTVSAIQPTATPIPVPTGGALRAKMALRNIGTTAPVVGIRSNYSYRPLGSSGPWTQIADDGSEPSDLIPGVDHWEEIISAVTAPTIPGWYELRGCADYQNASAESNEDDNCLIATFQVVPPLPDFIITAVGPAGGSSSIKAGSRFYPAMYVKNIGTANPTGGIRSAYYFSGPATGGAWVYITDDGTEASQLCVGCQYREQYDGGMKISVRGTYYFKGCADYPGWQTESNEANNCTVSGPITVY